MRVFQIRRFGSAIKSGLKHDFEVIFEGRFDDWLLIVKRELLPYHYFN